MTYEECIDACLACLRACNHCYDECLKENKVQMMVDCIRYDRSCADTCAFTIQALSANSPFIQEILALCALHCDACGKVCQEHAQHYDHCKECADACFHCAEVCRSYITA